MRSSSVNSQIGPRRARNLRGRACRGRPNLAMSPQARVKAPMMATNNGMRPRSPCREEFAAAGMIVVSAGAGEATGLGEILDAELTAAGCWTLAVGPTPDGCDQREATATDPALAPVAFARGAAFQSAAGGGKSALGES